MNKGITGLKRHKGVSN